MLVDYAALILDLRKELQERASWGRAQVLGLIDDLEQEHRVDESADAATIRRFSEHLTESFLGLVPRPSATSSPLGAADPSGTAAAMTGGAATDHPTEGTDGCPPPTPSTSTSPGLPHPARV